MSSPILPYLPSNAPAPSKSASTSQAPVADDVKRPFSDLVDAAKDQVPAKDEPAAPADETSAPAEDTAAVDTKADDTTSEQTPIIGPDGEVIVPDDKDTDTDSLDDLVDALAALDLNLQTGQQIDLALLDKIASAAQSLSTLLGLNNAPAAGEAPTTTPVDPASQLGQLAAKISDLADIVKTASPEVAEKLTALAEKLNSGQISPNDLAKLGFDAELKAADPAVNQALTALVAQKTAPKQPATVAVATPDLKAPELTLADTDIATPKAPSPVVALETAAKPSDASPATKQTKATEQVRATFGAMAAADQGAGQTTAADAPTQPDASASTTIGGIRTELPAGARVVQAAYQGPPSPINLPHMAFEIARQVHAGSNKFQIRLDPADLGRVDVSLDIDKNGTVNARLVVEKIETLDLMQRDQRSLEKALQQAGLDGAKTNLEFSLRQNSSGQQDNPRSGSPFGTGGNGNSGGDDAIAPISTTAYRGTASASGVNIFV